MHKTMTFLALSSAILLGGAQASHAAGGWIGLHPEQPQGVLVGDIIKESPADKSGLQRGDVILRLNDEAIRDPLQFSTEIHRLNPGAEVTLTVQRKNEVKTIKVKLESVADHVCCNAPPAPGSVGGGVGVGDHSYSPFAFNRSVVPVRPFGAIGAAHSHDYETRLKSTWSMLEAYERIAEEKKLGDPGKKLSGEIRGMLQQAQGLLDKYRLNEGMSVVESAYRKVQDALIQVRKGETLVQPRNFPNPEAEYVYELGSNNVFLMLLEPVTNAKGLAPDGMARIEEARALRGKAEENAARKEFKAGIGQLEQSTAILTELLRRTGLDIP
ncbi:MAG: PDZ domain-containing protein [Magnetococcales bacterium]|nr:PDZ domain-containing protein [Magnetococcales bacterium]